MYIVATTCLLFLPGEERSGQAQMPVSFTFTFKITYTIPRCNIIIYYHTDVILLPCYIIILMSHYYSVIYWCLV